MSSGSASTGTCAAGSRYRRSSGPAAGSSTSSSALAAWCSSHSRTYRSAVPVRPASSVEVAGPSAASARYRPSRSPRYTVNSSSAPTMSRRSRPARAAAASSGPPCAAGSSSVAMAHKLPPPGETLPGRLAGRLRLARRPVADDAAAGAPPGEVAPGQVDQRGDPVAPAEQGDQVQREPGEPGERAVDAHPARKLDDRGAVPDGGHDALVAVTERLRRPSLLEPGDLVRGVLAHLQGRLGELRQRLIL